MDAFTLVQRRNKMAVRIPLVAAGVVALLWGVWYLATGAIPDSAPSIMLAHTEYPLPFVVSRLWDIPAAALFAAMGVLLWYVVSKVGDEDLGETAADLALAAAVAVVVAVFAVAEREYKKGMVACATISVALAFGMGVGFALVFGGVVGLAAAALLAAGYTLLAAAAFTGVYAICWLVRHWMRIINEFWDWLLARDSSGSCG